MKLKLLFVAFLISVSVFGQNVPSYVPTNGLVGWWPFSGNANDESGNGNNGTVNGATLTTDRFGNGNSAYSFDGIDDFIDFGNVASLAVTNSSIISISFWGVNLNNGNPLSRYDNLNAPNSNFAVIWNTNGVGLQLTGNGTNGIQSSNFSLNTWTHVVAEFDGINSTASLYINGTLQVNGIVSYASSISTSPFFAGKVDGSFPGFFNGNIDDIAVYNRALTQQEITALYQSQQTQCLPAYVPTSGLVGWWPFCGNANDESGNGNNGTVNGAILTSDRNGNGNSAYSFDGIDDYIGCGPFNINSNSISINLWLKEFQLSNNINTIITKYDGNYFNGDTSISRSFELIRHNSTYQNRFYMSLSADGINTIDGFSSVQTSTGNWSMLSVSYNGSSFKYYWNGQLLTDTASSSIASIFNSVTPLYFGCFANNGSAYLNGVGQFNGLLDDIGIWNRALTQQEITALYLAQNCNGGNTITPDGPTTFCAGNSVKMTSSAVGATYQWRRNGVNISGATTRRYKAIQGGSYTCVATCNGTPVTSNTIQLTWLENKPVTLSAAGSTAFCVGDSVTLNVTNPGTNYSIQWYRTNISLPGQTGTSLVVTQPGTYKVVTRNNLNGCSRISSSGITTTSNCRMADREVSEGVSEDEEISSARVLDNENSQGVKIYPNPNQGRFRFEYRGHESGSATLQVINSMGQQLHEQRVEVVDGLLNTDIQLDGHFTSGIYIVRMVLNNGIHDSRVVVE